MIFKQYWKDLASRTHLEGMDQNQDRDIEVSSGQKHVPTIYWYV